MQQNFKKRKKDVTQNSINSQILIPHLPDQHVAIILKFSMSKLIFEIGIPQRPKNSIIKLLITVQNYF